MVLVVSEDITKWMWGGAGRVKTTNGSRWVLARRPNIH